jgi:Flp pilus assembly protein TadG
MLKKLKNNSRSNRAGKSRTGALTVEMAMCVPLLFLLLFSSIELARANMMLHATESAAYEGARVGIVPGATEAKIQTAVQFVLGSVGIKDFNVTVNPAVITNETETVEVTVVVPYDTNSSFTGFFVRGANFTGKTLLSREIPR